MCLAPVSGIAPWPLQSHAPPLCFTLCPRGWLVWAAPKGILASSWAWSGATPGRSWKGRRRMWYILPQIPPCKVTLDWMCPQQRPSSRQSVLSPSHSYALQASVVVSLPCVLLPVMVMAPTVASPGMHSQIFFLPQRCLHLFMSSFTETLSVTLFECYYFFLLGFQKTTILDLKRRYNKHGKKQRYEIYYLNFLNIKDAILKENLTAAI